MFRWLRKFVGNIVAIHRGEVDLWVDDLRPAPRGWYWATDIEDAWEILATCVVRRLSLDHDMGAGARGDGVDLVRRMVDAQELFDVSFWPAKRPEFHTANPVGRANMEALVNRYGPYNKEN